MRSRRLLETRREIVEALRRVKKEFCAEVYLFGSYARGTHIVDSDIDIIVVSEEFRGQTLWTESLWLENYYREIRVLT